MELNGHGGDATNKGGDSECEAAITNATVTTAIVIHRCSQKDLIFRMCFSAHLQTSIYAFVN